MITDDERPILLCYDRTDSSRHAIEAAGALFRGRRAIVLYIFTPMRVMADAPEGASWTAETIEQAALKLADEGVQAAIAAGFDAVPMVAPCSLQGVDPGRATKLAVPIPSRLGLARRGAAHIPSHPARAGNAIHGRRRTAAGRRPSPRRVLDSRWVTAREPNRSAAVPRPGREPARRAAAPCAAVHRMTQRFAG